MTLLHGCTLMFEPCSEHRFPLISFKTIQIRYISLRKWTCTAATAFILGKYRDGAVSRLGDNFL